MNVPRPQDTVVRTHADLFAVWQGLMGRGGFSVASIWGLRAPDDLAVAS
jgi:hypothetical protein